MKDKLRELAERWKAEASQWMIRGEDTPETLSHCATELLAILDAEGDGGAAPLAFLATNSKQLDRRVLAENIACGKHFEHPSSKENDWSVSWLYPHPARSGVVSDEDVRDAVVEYQIAAGRTGVNTRGLRAALEHFAKGERHER